jgi:hypothetical protein
MNTGFQCGKLTDREHVRRSRRTWEDSLIMDLHERGSDCVHWIYLAQENNQRWTVVYKDVAWCHKMQGISVEFITLRIDICPNI